MKRLLFICMLLCLRPAFAGDPFTTGGLAQPEFLPVTEAYQPLVSLDDKGDLLIQWSIRDGYYLYRDRFKARIQLGGETLQVSPRYEPGLEKDDPYFGLTTVYYLDTTLTLTQPPADQTFQLAVTAQGCADAGLCYPPHEWFFRIDTGNGSITELDALPSPAEKASRPAKSIGLMLLLALAGGAILNLMPCVFPVLSLKVLSFANAHSGRPAAHGATYSAGVVLSFIAIAALLIALQSAGRAVGWGFQLQEPWFVAALSCLFFLLSLNLLGVFQITGSWINLGAELTQNSGYSGSFFTGVLATLVATPCTAPFMGSAVGFAATQPAPVALSIFAMLGIGMALPIYLLTLFPGWLRLLPKPGNWMVRLRQFLAFPLLASALWLAWVIGRQTGSDGMAATLALWLLLGLILWLLPLGMPGRAAALIVAIAGGSWIAGSDAWHSQATVPVSAEESHYRPETLLELREQGHPVFLNVTADWCITCAANEALVLKTDEFKQQLAGHNTRYMIADWTLYDPLITELLAGYERNGIPLYLLFPADPSKPARVLPQILTQEAIRAALQQL